METTYEQNRTRIAGLVFDTFLLLPKICPDVFGAGVNVGRLTDGVYMYERKVGASGDVLILSAPLAEGEQRLEHRSPPSSDVDYDYGYGSVYLGGLAFKQGKRLKQEALALALNDWVGLKAYVKECRDDRWDERSAFFLFIDFEDPRFEEKFKTFQTHKSTGKAQTYRLKSVIEEILAQKDKTRVIVNEMRVKKSRGLKRRVQRREKLQEILRKEERSNMPSPS